MNEPEEWRKTERDARKAAAEVAVDMMRKPKSRWLLRPMYRVFKWVERKCDEALRDEGWR